MCSAEYGKCEICNKESVLERTYFKYAISCSCCGCTDKEGNPCHFVCVRHCTNCVPSIPTEIHPFIKAMDGKSYRTNITNILPVDIRGCFMIDKPVVEKGTETL